MDATGITKKHRMFVVLWCAAQMEPTTGEPVDTMDLGAMAVAVVPSKQAELGDEVLPSREVRSQIKLFVCSIKQSSYATSKVFGTVTLSCLCGGWERCNCCVFSRRRTAPS